MSFGPPLKSNHTEKEWIEYLYDPFLLSLYGSILKTVKENMLLQLIDCLVYDGKFYGAEWHEEKEN
jgi:hypothetical protein